MNVSSTSNSASASAEPSNTPPRKTLRQFLAIDEREALIEGAQTLPGQTVIFLVSLLAVAAYFPWWEAALMVGVAMGAAYAPNFRGRIIFAGTWTAAYLEMFLEENYITEHIALVLEQEHLRTFSPVFLGSVFLLLMLLGAWASLAWVGRHPKCLLARRPMVVMLATITVLGALTSVGLTHGLPRVLLWSALIVLVPYVWFLPYAIVDQRSQPANNPLLSVAVLRPFWSPSFIPFGKGAAYLKKMLSKTPRDLAVTQLKAIKLLLWSNGLYGIKLVLLWVFREQMEIPVLEASVDAYLGGQPYPIAVGWAAMTLSTALYGLKIAYWAHIFIGVARLAGYRLPRGSWRPLESRTLMDYFNRFHYYFKELLVDFFFVPTFFKMFRGYPRLRMFFATFMAAGVGNALWHFSREIHFIATMGVAGSVETFTSYIFYCVVLATGVGLSQVRVTMGIRPSSTVLGRIYSFFFVWSFVVCMHLFSDESREHSFTERMNFFLSLFGVN